MIIDTGASINILDTNAYRELQSPPLHTKHETNAFTYGSSSSMKFIGKLIASVEKHRKIVTVEFLVVNGYHGSLMSYELALELGIVNTINAVKWSVAEQICDKFPEVFSGLVKVKGLKVQLDVDESVKPVACAYRRQPYHLRKKIADKVRELEKQDLIEKVTGPTPWIVPLVAVPKSTKTYVYVLTCEVRTRQYKEHDIILRH